MFLAGTAKRAGLFHPPAFFLAETDSFSEDSLRVDQSWRCVRGTNGEIPYIAGRPVNRIMSDSTAAIGIFRIGIHEIKLRPSRIVVLLDSETS